jgi:hypothetical protein
MLLQVAVALNFLFLNNMQNCSLIYIHLLLDFWLASSFSYFWICVIIYISLYNIGSVITAYMYTHIISADA